MVKHITALGASVADAIRGVGQNGLLLMACLKSLFKGWPDKKETIRQFYFIGVQSIPVIMITGAFVGAVLAYTTYNQFVALGVESWTGAIVAKAQVWQLGPVLVGLMLAGRVGCSMTAELGTMNVTEQIDALETMGTDPVRYLVLPRLIASFVMTPMLTIFAMAIGIFAGLFITVIVMGAEFHYQWAQISDWMIPYDYVQGLSKGLVFGVTICLVCCRNGLQTTGGAEGVGKATTEANVSSCIAILIINLIMSILLYYFQSTWDTIAYYLDSAMMAITAAVQSLFGGSAY
ncbi:MAG: ABC transporter permease [Planctomycetes bacterium]|nr:ABC transporter permease [Planctomycetota bacterium]